MQRLTGVLHSPAEEGRLTGSRNSPAVPLAFFVGDLLGREGKSYSINFYNAGEHHAFPY